MIKKGENKIVNSNVYNVPKNIDSFYSNNLDNEISFIKEDMNNTENMNLCMISMQENDRNRIARDLHDSTIQRMAALIHKSELCLLTLDDDPIRTKLELQSIIENLKVSIKEMREIIYNLRPVIMDNEYINESLEKYCKHIGRDYDIDIAFEKKGKEKNISSLDEITIYRVAQEACQNAIKHANAKSVKMKLNFGKDNITLTVSDDGCGFDVSMAEGKEKSDTSGMGLITMKERALLAGGKLDVSSKIDYGTVVRLDIPVRSNGKGELHGTNTSDTCR